VSDPADAPDLPLITVIGEALIDLVPHGGPHGFHALPGGSPFNVALGLARLGQRTALMARLADNAFGRILRRHAETEGIDLTAAPSAREPTTLAVVSMDADARASYDFYAQGTADWQWTAAEIARIPTTTAVVHLGSLSSWTPPGDRHLRAAASRLRQRGDVLVSYDPNIRPTLLGDPRRARPLIESMVTAAHLVKASREDVEWLYPGGLQHAGPLWIGLGARLVVITDGAHGAHAYRSGSAPLTRPGRRAAVVDTVGAGDAFTAGLLSALVRRGLHTVEALDRSSAGELASALDDAVLVSALTCERAGADPPILLGDSHLPAGAPLSASDLSFASREPGGTGEGLPSPPGQPGAAGRGT
jgi:fructokinase